MQPLLSSLPALVSATQTPTWMIAATKSTQDLQQTGRNTWNQSKRERNTDFSVAQDTAKGLIFTRLTNRPEKETRVLGSVLYSVANLLRVSGQVVSPLWASVY